MAKQLYTPEPQIAGEHVLHSDGKFALSIRLEERGLRIFQRMWMDDKRYLRPLGAWVTLNCIDFTPHDLGLVTDYARQHGYLT